MTYTALSSANCTLYAILSCAGLHIALTGAASPLHTPSIRQHYTHDVTRKSMTKDCPPHLLDALVKVGLQGCASQELSSALQHDVDAHALIRDLWVSECVGD